MFRWLLNEPRVSIECLAGDGQFHARCLLHVAYPLAIPICGREEDSVIIYDEPDGHVVRLPSFPAVVSQGQGLSMGEALQRGKCGDGHKAHGKSTSSA